MAATRATVKVRVGTQHGVTFQVGDARPGLVQVGGRLCGSGCFGLAGRLTCGRQPSIAPTSAKEQYPKTCVAVPYRRLGDLTRQVGHVGVSGEAVLC